MLVDYHFHPNLSKYDFFAKRKCLKIWHEFARQKVDVVVATEHVYKNPPRAYRLLCETRPATATTVLFPGLEALTSESVDVIVFAKDDSIYQHQKLMVPKQLNLMEMAKYVQQEPNLFGSIAHPVLRAHSGSERRVGKAATIAAIQMIGGAEISNSCLKGFVASMRLFRLERILKKQRAECAQVMALPIEYYNSPQVTLYTGGSDAHTLDEIGSGMNVQAAPLEDRTAVFAAISSNQSKDFKIRRFGIHPYFALFKLYSVVRESTIKAFRLYEGKIYQNDDAFTNYYSEAEKETVLAWRERRAVLLKPLLNFLNYYGISPTLLNIVSFLLIIASVVQVTQGEPYDAIAYFFLYLLVNSLTGPLERYRRTESEVGAITKIILYQFVLITGMLAAMALNWVDNWLGAVYLSLYTIMLWLIITLNKIGKPIQLVIRSKNIVLAAMLLKITTNLNILTPLVGAFSVYMVIINTIMVIRLLQSIDERERAAK